MAKHRMIFVDINRSFILMLRRRGNTDVVNEQEWPQNAGLPRNSQTGRWSFREESNLSRVDITNIEVLRGSGPV